MIGSANFLHDKSQTPHLQLGKLCELFGIGKSTATAKARSIEKLMGISYFDPRWSLPSKLDDNPLVWMLTVNGFAVDIRRAPLEFQEEALRRGSFRIFRVGKRNEYAAIAVQHQHIGQRQARTGYAVQFAAAALKNFVFGEGCFCVRDFGCLPRNDQLMVLLTFQFC